MHTCTDTDTTTKKCILTRVSANTSASVHLRKIRTCTQTRIHIITDAHRTHTHTHARFIALSKMPKTRLRHAKMIPNTNQKHAQKPLESIKRPGICPTANKNESLAAGFHLKHAKREPNCSPKRRQEETNKIARLHQVPNNNDLYYSLKPPKQGFGKQNKGLWDTFGRT